MKDNQGREYAKLSDLKAGDKLEIDDGFDCLNKGDIKEIKKDALGLYIDCAGGEAQSDATHYLNGQLDEDNQEYLIGMYKVNQGVG